MTGIGAVDEALCQWGFVAAVVDRFSRKNPKVQFNVLTADSATLHRRELAQRNIEIALEVMFDVLPAQNANVEGTVR